MFNINRLLLIFCLLISSNFQIVAQLPENVSEYNGIYEGQLSNYKNKKLAKLYIYKYDFSDPLYGKKVNKTTNTLAYPYEVVGKIDIYDNKKGKGKPKTTFFSAISYDLGEHLDLTSIKKYFLNDDGSILKRNDKSFRIPKPNTGSTEIKVFDYYRGTFKKVKDFNLVPDDFKEFLNAALKNQANEKTGILRVGGSGDKGLPIVTKEYLNVNDTLHAKIYSTTMTYLKNKPSKSKIIELERAVNLSLKNSTQGAHTVLKFLPHVKFIKLYLTNSDSSKEMMDGDYIFLVKVNKLGKHGISYEIIDYPKQNELNTLIAEENHRNQIDTERKRKVEQLLIAEKDNKEIKLANQLQNKGFKVMEKSFWNQFPNQKILFKGVVEGNFGSIDNNFVFKSFFLAYLNHISNSCTSLLPNNKRELTITYNTTEKNYSHTTYNGGWDMGSFTQNYNTEEKTHTRKMYIDPRFENKYYEIKRDINKEFLEMMFSGSFASFSIKDKNEIEGFYRSLGCDKQALFYIGENFLRYLNNQKSLQTEAGVVFE